MRHQQIKQGISAAVVCAVVLAVWFVGKNPLIPLILALAPLGLLVVVSKGFLVILAFVIFSFFRLHEVFPLLLPLKIPLLLALGSFTALGWGIFSGKIRPFWTRELTVFLAFFVLVVLGCLLATNRGLALEALTGTFAKIALIVPAIAWMTTGVKELRQAAWMICLSGLIVGCVTLFNAANGIGLVEGTRVTVGRDIGSMLGDPNDLALVLLFPSAFGLSFLLSRDCAKSERLLGGLTIAIMFLAILATQSRGGLLGLVAVCGVFAWTKVPSRTLLIVGGVIAVLGLFALAGIEGRSSGGAQEQGIDDSAMGRLHAWKAAVKMALHNPMTGIGLDNFYANYFDYSDFWDGKNHAVHSTWFGVLAETGFPGFGLFLVLVFLCVRNMMSCCTRTNKECCTRTKTGCVARIESGNQIPYLHTLSLALLAGLAGFCASGTFLTMGFTWPFYIMLGLSIALRHIVSQNENQTRSQGTKIVTSV